MYSLHNIAALTVVVFISFLLFLLQVLSSIFYSFDLSQLSFEFWLANSFYYLVQALIVGAVLCFKATIYTELNANIVQKKKLISNICLFLSFLGIMFMFIDRIYYRGIDYTVLNFVEVRNILNSSLDAKVGFSSVFSVVGNLLQYLFFYSVIYIFYYSRKKVTSELCTCFLVIMCVVLTSFLLGGRSIIMMLVLFILSLFVIKLLIV